jgi:hypothetical protein
MNAPLPLTSKRPSSAPSASRRWSALQAVVPGHALLWNNEDTTPLRMT